MELGERGHAHQQHFDTATCDVHPAPAHELKIKPKKCILNGFLRSKFLGDPHTPQQ